MADVLDVGVRCYGVEERIVCMRAICDLEAVCGDVVCESKAMLLFCQVDSINSKLETYHTMELMEDGDT
jgi:hypothetical protein